MFKPAPYLTHAACLSQPHTSPTHPAPTNSNSFGFVSAYYPHYTLPPSLSHALRNPRADYKDRLCPHCLHTGIPVLGDEIHFIFHCPATKGVLEQLTSKFQGTRLLDLPPFLSFKPDEMTRMAHGTPPPLCVKNRPKGMDYRSNSNLQ